MYVRTSESEMRTMGYSIAKISGRLGGNNVEIARTWSQTCSQLVCDQVARWFASGIA